MLLKTRSEQTPDMKRAALAANQTDRYVPDSIYAATRSLMRIASADDAISILSQLVRRLGGDIVRRSDPGEDGIEIDISLGHGEPIYPAAKPGSAAHWLITTYMPNLVKDAHAAFALAHRAELLAKDAGIDPVSGLPNHRTLSRLVTRLGPGDSIVAVDLDWVHAIGNPEMQEDHAVLRAFARELRQATRANEFCGRSSGGEFVALLNDPGPEGSFKLLERLADRWARRPPTMPLTFSGGIALIDDRGWRPAIQAADSALRRCQERGNCWELARPEDYS